MWLGIHCPVGTVMALLNENGTIKTLFGKVGTVELHSANEPLKPILVKESNAFRSEGKQITQRSNVPRQNAL